MSDLLTRRYALIARVRGLLTELDDDVDQATHDRHAMAAIAARAWARRFHADLVTGRYDQAALDRAERAADVLAEAVQAGDLTAIVDPQDQPPALEIEGGRLVSVTQVRPSQTVRGPRAGHMRRLRPVGAR